ncbi:MAG: pitrilysin family protein [Myxococcota bacterium]
MSGGRNLRANPFSGRGDTESVEAITRADLLSFRDRWLRPDNATIFAAGDSTLAEIKPLLESAFGDWKAPATAKGTKSVVAATPASPRVVIIDRPGSPQTMILAGHLAPPTGVENNLAIEAMNDGVGGQFTARINMNLREDKGWAYGAYTFLPDAREARPFMVYAPVQTDQTAPSIAELRRELKEYLGKKPLTNEEFDRVMKNLVRSLPGQFQTRGSVMGAMLENARFGRPDDYVATLTERYRALSKSDALEAAQQVIRPDELIWLLVGDRAKIEPAVRALNLGPIETLDVK